MGEKFVFDADTPKLQWRNLTDSCSLPQFLKWARPLSPQDFLQEASHYFLRFRICFSAPKQQRLLSQQSLLLPSYISLLK